MSYIGAEPTTAAFPFDQFSGNGTTTAFTLTYAPASTTSIIVAISGVVQNPNLYSVIGTTITFSPAPPTGTNNISVLYLGLPVQIGTPIPGSRLELALGSAANPSLTFLGDTNTGIFSPAADTIAFSEGGVESMRIDSAGNVGIGTSSPGNALAIYRGASVAAFIDLTGNANTAGTSNVVIGQNADDGGYFWNRKSSFLSFGTNNTERARIDPSGNLLVNATSATGRGSDAQFVSIGNGKDASYIRSASNSLFAICSHVNTTSGTRFHIGFGDGTTWTERGTISTNGSTTTYSTSSDYRLKENISPMTGALATVAQLKPCTYTWKESGATGQGFIAHELQEVVPDAVIGEKDAVKEDGSIQPQAIDTSFLVATLTAAIQELKAELDATKAEVALLKGAA